LFHHRFLSELMMKTRTTALDNTVDGASPSTAAGGATSRPGPPIVELALHPTLVADGRFAVDRCLGMGGFGAVFAARDTRTNADVAIKWLRTTDVGTISRFKREFRSLADLVHPNLVHFRELITIAGEWFVTMDLVRGVELMSWVRPVAAAPTSFDRHASTVESTAAECVPSSAPRSEDAGAEPGRSLCTTDMPRLRSALEQLASALEAIHAAGMMHRDVKPSNVLVTREGRVVLLDFGLVTEVGDDGVARTAPGNVVGTPAYMSPEQATGGPITAASDWYAVGTILWEALTGRPPFAGDAGAILVRKQYAEPPPANHLVRGVPRALSDLCVDLLARDPRMRPDGAQIRERLRLAIPCGAPSTPPRVTRSATAGAEHAGVFVGRETHLWALDEAADEAERGATVIALVHGASGMGKSALVRRFLSRVRAERPEAVILEGRCYEHESMPYGALDSLLDALCRYLHRLPEAKCSSLLPRDFASLARIFPMFRQLASRAARRARPSADAGRERVRAFEALRELLGRVAERNPLVLFIDDLQWGGGDSEPLLTALFKPPEPPPLLLVASYRTEDASTAPLVRALHRLSSLGAGLETCEIPVTELSPDASRDLASSLLRTGHKALVADALARESLGSPLFLKQLASLDEDADRCDLATALARRVEAQGPEARRLLELLAISPKPVRAHLVARAARIDEDVDGLVARLCSETLIRTRGVEARDEVELYHDRIRQILLSRLSATQIATLHAGLARVLSSTGDADAEALAVHFSASGERRRAAEYAESAADRARTALAFARAAELYRMAIELSSPGSPRSRVLELKLAEAFVCAGRRREAAERFLGLAGAASSRVDALELRARAAEQLLFSGRVDDGLRVVADVLEMMGMRSPKTPLGAVVSLILSRLLLAVRGLGFRRRSVDDLPRGQLARLDACYGFGVALGMLDPIMGADLQTRYLLLSLAAGEPTRIAKGLALEAAYRAADGEKGRSAFEKFLARAESLSGESRDPHARVLASLMRGVVKAILGDFAGAVPICDRAATKLRDTCARAGWELDSAEFFAAHSLMSCGRVPELRRRTQQLIDDARSRGDLYCEVLVRVQCAWFVALATDDVAQAETDLAALDGAWTGERFLLQHAWQMHNRAEVAIYDGVPNHAAAVIDDAWQRLERSMLLRTKALRARVSNLVGRVALARAIVATDEDERGALLTVAAREARGLIRARWSLAAPYGHLLEAGITAARGHAEGAARRYARAAVELEDKGAALYAVAARLRGGQLAGGEEGRARVERALREMSEAGIVAPLKLARMLAPAAELSFA
jgi:eukaryotic-like serine/threonine-protein kinase